MKGWIGLCLALAFVIVGCKAAPQSEISHDGKWLAYSNAGNGITVVETANTAHKRHYNMEMVDGFEWSNTNRYLAWGNSDKSAQLSKISVTLLDLQSNKTRRLPVHMIPPFIWSKDDGTLTGFAPDGPFTNINDIKSVKRVEFDVRANKKLSERSLGNRFPFAAYPSGDVLLVGKEQSLFRLHGDTITPLAKFDNIKGDPSGFSSDDRILVTQSVVGQGANKAFYVDDRGDQENIPLPTILLNKSARLPRLEGISSDTNWLLVRRETELTKPLRRGKQLLHYKETYAVMSRKTARDLSFCDVYTDEHDANPGTSATWSDDGGYLCFGVTPDEKNDKSQVWLIDLQKWTKVKLRL